MTVSSFFVERLSSAPCSICFESCIELVLVINNRKSSATGSRWTKGKSSTLHRLRANLKQSSTDVNSRENHLPGQGGHHLLRAHTRRYFYSRVGAFICSRPTIESCDVKKCVHQIMLDLLLQVPRRLFSEVFERSHHLRRQSLVRIKQRASCYQLP